MVIPARNEEASLGRTIDELELVVGRDWEIVVVDDHSTDRTAEVARSKMRQYGNVRLVRNERPPGFASALWTGLEAARGEYVVPVMADMCDDPETIPRMLEKMREGYDVVCGSRYMRGGKKLGGPQIQTFMSRLVCEVVHLLMGVPTRDASNAFKMYRRQVLDGMRTRCKGFAVSMEIFVRALASGCRVAEVPTTWRERRAGEAKFRIMRAIKDYLIPCLLLSMRALGWRVRSFRGMRDT